MKTKKQLEYQIKKLTKLCETTKNKTQATAAYEAYHTLRWVIEKVDWTPVQNLNGLKDAQ